MSLHEGLTAQLRFEGKDEANPDEVQGMILLIAQNIGLKDKARERWALNM